ncbi:MAG: sulfite exporter TauE/SafE family protein [Bryobacterales bacterium]|nr:sulfite exporter TauE/SafE family protein [Bryobacterales bacterium]
MPLSLAAAGTAFGAAFAAGAINSVAGGGTLITFPTLVFLGLPSVVANATNTVAIWPGSLGGMWGYRRELKGSGNRLLALAGPSLLGGLLGAILLRYTPPVTFDRLVPYLILFATVLFMAQQPVQKLLGTPHPEHARSPRWLAGAMLFQFGVALYGGYFGAGIGILMLAALAILGLTDIHQMNGWKNFFALCINGVAALYFVWAGMVNWPFTAVMAAGAIAGGVGGAGAARRIGRVAVRRIVIAIGFGMAISLFLKK